ncbi:ectonucleotide pyrophosphatase/phosphodiesterase family member 1 [Betta splendens]|uniref:Ectonucleotide pyrophosphatase/phosphodiesterase family member 1 n=1 Tax=Betta splendens TaxID=158456 RepID=A0A6P7LRM8_BETSP|nr:ectonucleotide pyrophosphatase/phosphodiesterase family member 1 [Betta splendens]
MDSTKGDSTELAATLFRTGDMENERRNAAQRNKWSRRWKIITGALLLLLLLVLLVFLAVVLSLRSGAGAGGEELWPEEPTEDSHCPPGFSRAPLILVSLDGFRAEYLKDHGPQLPVLSRLRSAGTTAPYMRPVYPTKTFPNHYAIVTGLYPESHGIVDNKMYDVARNAFFSLKTDEKLNPAWYQGEPVWITAMRQNLTAATFFWPGSDVPIKDTYPTFYKPYDKSVTFETRLSTLFSWLSLPKEQRPDFYTLYLEEPDSSGHSYGPESSQVVTALKNVDRILGLLLEGLAERNLHHCVNLMVVSDHGMEEASCEKAAFISNYQDDTGAFTLVQGPAARIRPARLPDDFFSFDYEGLVRNLSCRTPDQPMRPYLKENLPKRMHFANNQRIERGHLYMKPGWQAALNRKEIKYCRGGFHGSDNLFTNMQAIFIGYGPGFKNKTVVPPFENIELYNLMCDLLRIRPAPNNGTHGSLNHLLRRPFHQPGYPAALSYETPCLASGPSPTDDLQCTCASQTSAMERDLNRLLMSFNTTSKTGVQRLHSPFGIPKVVQQGATFCLLHHSDYLNGFSKDRLMPLWVSYTVRPLTGVRPTSPESQACVRADVRVPPAASQTCARYRGNPTLTYGLLHPPNLSYERETDSLLTSNMAPMFPAFKDVWIHIHDVLLPKYSRQLNGTNVLSGPIFDVDYNGQVDALRSLSGNEAPVPTHFFLILSSCGNSTFGPLSCEGRLRASAFILPHRPDHTESCANGSDLSWVEDWLKFHAARVRDVELLTGLSFYNNRISVEETLQLKTFLQTP